jgi:glycosyltransferase involved in cell wall biosynthesis
MKQLDSLTIIICFYNAENKLSNTLKAIKSLDVTGVKNIELLLINNKSNDNSISIIKDELADFNKFECRIIDEPRAGLTNARFCGVENAKYETLLFCDDDNWLDTNYVTNGMNILNSNTSIGILGGLGEAVSDVAIPNWFQSVENYYAVGPQGIESGQIIGERNVVYGAGMFVRKDYLLKILEKGFISQSSDRVGNNLSSGGDSELCLVFQIAGYLIWYDESLKFKHFIESKRLKLEYLSSLQKGIDKSGFVTKFYRLYFQGYRPIVTKMFWLKELIYLLKDGIIALYKMNFDYLKNLGHQFYFIAKNRSKYNHKVKLIIQLCDNISNLCKN